MGHIFVSYAREDAAFARELEDRLVRAGFQVWKDTSRLNAGTEWASGIDAAVDGCDVLILVISPASMNSRYVNYEWARALGGSTPVLPVLLKDAKLHPRLEAIEHLDFRNQRCWEKLFVEVGATRARKSDLPPVVRAATASLDDPSPERQLEAVGQLGQLDHPSARAALIQALWHPNRDVCRLAVHTLGEATAREACEALLRVAEDESYPCRDHVLWALSEIPRPAPVYHALRRLITSKDELERAAALRGLGHARDPADISAFIQALDHESPSVRFYACEGLKAFGERALPQLLQATKGRLTPQKRYALIRVFLFVGNDRAVPFLALCLSDEDETIGDLTSIQMDHTEGYRTGGGGEDIRSAAKRALEDIGTPAARRALVAYQKRETRARAKGSLHQRSSKEDTQ